VLTQNASALGTYAQLLAALYEYGREELVLCFLYLLFMLSSFVVPGRYADDAESSFLHKVHQHHVMHCMCCMHPTSAESYAFCAAGVVVYNFVEGGVHMAQTSPLHLHSLPVTFGLSAFVYSGHAVFPSIYRSMKDRSQYPRMLDTTYAIVGITGAFMGEPHMRHCLLQS